MFAEFLHRGAIGQLRQHAAIQQGDREIEGDGDNLPNAPATKKKLLPGQDEVELFDIPTV